VSVSANADTKANTLWGDGAPEVLDLRLLEDGGERGGALDSDVVCIETVGEGRSEDGKRAAVSRGALTQKQLFWLMAHRKLVI
jgi:hypothetical protein